MALKTAGSLAGTILTSIGSLSSSSDEGELPIPGPASTMTSLGTTVSSAVNGVNVDVTFAKNQNYLAAQNYVASLSTEELEKMYESICIPETKEETIVKSLKI